MNQLEEREFFVGYLRMPRKLAVFYTFLIVFFIGLVTAVALWLSSAQLGAGQGTWNAFDPVTMNGVLALEPYPVLHVSEPEPVSVLVVQVGKHAADILAADFVGKAVSVTGFAIARGEWTMLEIEGGDAIKVLQQNTSKLLENTTESFGNITLRGEIVDSKCFLGVMKPGAGSVHRACATLCLKGGLPPMLVAKSLGGERQGYLLTGADGTSAAVALAPLAAVPVEISGELEQRGQLMYLRMSDDVPKRLTGLAREAYGDTLAMALTEEKEVCYH